MKKLNLGCADEILEGYDNVDFERRKGILVWDLNKFPYPFKDNTYDEILAEHLIEHLFDTYKFLNELIRISKNGARIKFITPHVNSWSAFSHIQHYRYFHHSAFEDIEFHIKGLKCIEVKLISSRVARHIPFKRFLSKFINGLIRRMEIELKVVK